MLGPVPGVFFAPEMHLSLRTCICRYENAFSKHGALKKLRSMFGPSMDTSSNTNDSVCFQKIHYQNVTHVAAPASFLASVSNANNPFQSLRE